MHNRSCRRCSQIRTHSTTVRHLIWPPVYSDNIVKGTSQINTSRFGSKWTLASFGTGTCWTSWFKRTETQRQAQCADMITFHLFLPKKCTSYIFKENLKWPCSNHCTSISHPKELDLLLIFPKNNRNCIQNFFINYHIKDVHFIIFLEHACTCISKLKYWIPCMNLADTMFLF